MNQKVIVAIDHSLQAENAVRYYLEKMHRPGNQLILVHGIDMPEMSIQNARERHVSPAVLASMWKDEERKCKALENKMKNLVKDQNVTTRLRSHVGKPGEVVCHFAVQEQAAYVVIGACDVSALKRVVLGSVGDYILRHAPCPVIMCRDPVQVERHRRRHASADSGQVMSRNIVPLQRECGDDLTKTRHKSGEGLTKLASGFRRRFASGTGTRTTRSVDNPQVSVFFCDTITILYPEQGNVAGDAVAPDSITSMQPDEKVSAELEQ